MARRKSANIEAELRKLKKLLKLIPENKHEIALNLFERAAFMLIELQKLEGIIAKNGCTSEYQNGENQWGTKKAPEVEVHISMTKNYSMIMRQINDMIPAEVSGGIVDDGFENFVGTRG